MTLPIIPIPHDGLFKAFMQDIVLARQFFAVHLPPKVKPYCDLSTLEIRPTAVADDNLRQHCSDIRYPLDFKILARHLRRRAAEPIWK